MGRIGENDHVRGALVLAKRMGELMAQRTSASMTKAERLTVESEAMIESRAQYPDLAVSWDRTHSAMGGALAGMDGSAVAFQTAVKIAMGRAPVDSQLEDPRGAELLRKCGLLEQSDIRKLAECGHEESLRKVLAEEEPVTKADQTVSAPPNVAWWALTAWAQRATGDQMLSGHEGYGILQAFRERRMPDGHVIKFGFAVISDPSVVDWTDFEKRWGVAPGRGTPLSGSRPTTGGR